MILLACQQRLSPSLAAQTVGCSEGGRRTCKGSMTPFGLQDWITMGEAPKREWMESVQLVFDYFCERTPRSFVEARDTSVVWNYKYAGERG